jgi:acyl dehydratase
MSTKRVRILGWDRKRNYRPFHHPETSTVRVALVDQRESDRIQMLVLSVEDAEVLGFHLYCIGQAAVEARNMAQ